ncbi:MAG: serine protease [Actinomycetota bacterium]
MRPLAAFVVAVALGATACASDDPVGANDLVVVGVAADGCGLEPAFGTGVAVDHAGEVLVVTSAHTVAGATEVSLRRATGIPLPATVVAFDPDRDVAVIRADSVRVGRPIAEPAAGAPATAVVWSPDVGLESFDTSITRLLRVTIEDIYVEDIVERRAFEFDGVITAGDSGAPVFAEDGDVLGIVYARSRSRGVGFAVSTTEIRPVLDTVTDRRADTGPCI